jgi:hypothetical protein
MRDTELLARAEAWLSVREDAAAYTRSDELEDNEPYKLLRDLVAAINELTKGD